MSAAYELTHRAALEADAVHLLREVAATAERPVLLLSGGEDESVLLHIAVKAFWPFGVPFGALLVDVGHHPLEVGERRAALVGRYGVEIGVVEIDHDGAADAPSENGPGDGRGQSWTRASMRAITEGTYDAVIGNGHDGRSPAGASGRLLDVRDEYGRSSRTRQRPQMWRLYNGRHGVGEHVRVFPLSTWTESDVREYAAAEGITVVGPEDCEGDS